MEEVGRRTYTLGLHGDWNACHRVGYAYDDRTTIVLEGSVLLFSAVSTGQTRPYIMRAALTEINSGYCTEIMVFIGAPSKAIDEDGVTTWSCSTETPFRATSYRRAFWRERMAKKAQKPWPLRAANQSSGAVLQVTVEYARDPWSLCARRIDGVPENTYTASLGRRNLQKYVDAHNLQDVRADVRVSQDAVATRLAAVSCRQQCRQPCRQPAEEEEDAAAILVTTDDGWTFTVPRTSILLDEGHTCHVQGDCTTVATAVWHMVTGAALWDRRCAAELLDIMHLIGANWTADAIARLHQGLGRTPRFTAACCQQRSNDEAAMEALLAV
jgi:hypothetical protein